MNLDKKYIMLVGTLNKTFNKYGSINSWYKDTADSIQELKDNLKNYYAKCGTTWEEHPYLVRVYRLIHEDNGYVHSSNDFYFSATTKDFWLK